VVPGRLPTEVSFGTHRPRRQWFRTRWVGSLMLYCSEKKISFCFSFYFSTKLWVFLVWQGGLDQFHIDGQSGQVSLSSKPINFTHSLIQDNADEPSPLTAAPPWVARPLCLSASPSASVGVHQRQLYCFCKVRLFRVFLWPSVCTPGGIVKVCLGSYVFTHPRPQK